MRSIFLITILLFCIKPAVSQTKEETRPIVIETGKNDSASPEIFTLAEEMPEYPEGIEALKTYIQNNIRLPEKVKTNAISAKVFAKLLITDQGTISKIIILKGIKDCEECNTEAIRVIKTITKFNPAKMGGKPVNCYYNLPVKFEAK